MGKVQVLILGWVGLLLAGLLILQVFLGERHGGGFLWAAMIGFTWAIAYWPVTLIVLGLGFWASDWWLRQR
ncbi:MULTISPECIES: hypothetical protein [unclassified Mesorhizobium]|uniref:hypothetical protein n=1 Tax=unclassified Mesorhizobium TaxID=325217 RepID=UPI001CC92A71|nr:MULTISPECIES: hypothetical protein [unclassified Mesorhizobium]MBZ9684644.1 hypothetical protein [Mesorhizobium sp. CO1-1-2]MBZ9924564.1 hypothetical protein [Mesorhizobium sp. BR1-1-4]